MRILITGSREFTNKIIITTTIKRYIYGHQKLLHIDIPTSKIYLAHGNAIGADRLSEECALAIGLPKDNIKKYPITAKDWETRGKAAGPIRNTEMLEDFKPDICLAFYKVGAKNIGTMDMVRKALNKGVRVIITPEL